MRWKRLISGLSRNRTGIALLEGAAAILIGVERALSSRPGPRVRVTQQPSPTPATTIAKPARTSYFTIRQTRSELGYVYWVLRGFGCYQSFALFDTWAEARDAANARLAQQTVEAPDNKRALAAVSS